jgi:serine/threonine-protein kinase
MAQDNLVGQTLGQYELRELLGVGGMGAVYRGFQLNLKREVAVKVLPSTLATEQGYAERFNREAQTAAALEHPHIVSIFDYGTQRGTSYLVMRLLTGGTLAQRLQLRVNDKLVIPSLGETAGLLNQLASALAYAHAQGVIHRDIKTSNVMFDNQGNGYLVDFGIAKLMGASSGLTGTGMAMGTPSYMPPEQWAGQELSPAADQYALAVLVYAMVTGRVPFEANTPYELLHKHLHELPTPPQVFRSDLPDAVNLVMARALAKVPEDRFASVSSFAQSFESAVEGQRGDLTAFFTSKIPIYRTPQPYTPGGTPMGSGPVTPRSMSGSQGYAGGTPSSGYGGGTPPPGGYISGTPPSGTYPPGTGVTAPRPIYKNPIAWGVFAVVLLLAAILVVLIGGQGGTAIAAATATNSNVVILSTETATDSPTADVTATDIATATETATIESSDTPTHTSTATDLPTATETEPAPTTVAVVTEQPAPTETPITPTPGSGVTATVRATQSEGVNIILTETATPTDEPTAEPSATHTQTPTDTVTPSATATDIPTETPTATNTDIPTLTPTETASSTSTDLPTETPSNTATATATETPTETPTSTHTATPTHTFTPTETPTETHTPTPTLTPTTDPSTIDLVFASFRSGTSQIYGMDTSTQQTTQLTFEGSNVDPAWSPDGQQIAFSSNRGGTNDLWVMNISGDGLRQVTDLFADELGATWSPDGQYIAFRSDYQNSTSDIFVIKADGTGLVRLTEYPGYDLAPAWSPDGQKIAFHSDREGGDYDLVIMNYDGSDPVVITDNTDYDADPAWFPDGQSLVFESDTGSRGIPELYSINTLGFGVVRITNNTFPDYFPAMSNDGSKISFESQRDSAIYDLYLLNVLTGEETRLTQGTDDSSSQWRPDGVIRVAQLPEITPRPSATDTPVPPTSTPSPTLVPTSAATETPQGPTVFMTISNRPVLVYNLPQQTATAINVTRTRIPVTGITTDLAWYRVEVNDGEGWVLINTPGYTVEGNLASLPIAAPGDSQGELSSDPAFLSIMAQSPFDTMLPSIENEGWNITDVDGESALCSDVGGAFLSFGDTAWSDYEVIAEFQFRGTESGSFNVITRMDNEQTGIRHGVSADKRTVYQYTLRTSNGRSLGMGEVGVNIRPKQWAILRAEVDGQKIRTFFDGLQISEYELLDAGYSAGIIGLEAPAGTVVCINNIQVRSLYRTADAVEFAPPRARANGSANIRMFPGGGFSRVGAVSSGEEVFVMADSEDGEWSYVRRDRNRNPIEGWISKNLITVLD